MLRRTAWIVADNYDHGGSTRFASSSGVQTCPPGTDWQSFSVQAEASPAGPRPVFHTRLIIAAAPGSTVHVDDVVMSVTP